MGVRIDTSPIQSFTERGSDRGDAQSRAVLVLPILSGAVQGNTKTMRDTTRNTSTDETHSNQKYRSEEQILTCNRCGGKREDQFGQICYGCASDDSREIIESADVEPGDVVEYTGNGDELQRGPWMFLDYGPWHTAQLTDDAGGIVGRVDVRDLQPSDAGESEVPASPDAAYDVHDHHSNTTDNSSFIDAERGDEIHASASELTQLSPDIRPDVGATEFVEDLEPDTPLPDAQTWRVDGHIYCPSVDGDWFDWTVETAVAEYDDVDQALSFAGEMRHVIRAYQALPRLYDAIDARFDAQDETVNKGEE